MLYFHTLNAGTELFGIDFLVKQNTDFILPTLFFRLKK